MPGQGPPRRIRVLVLSADVGEGHVAAARALAQRLRRRGGVDVAVCDGLEAFTCVLGRLRVRRRLDVPVCVTVTDFDGYGVWSHRGADRHLVMHADAVAAVERRAGAGSAALVGPLVAARFLTRRAPSTARACLGLPAAGRVAVVSGGGWGVGDLAGAVDAALGLELADMTVVALAGRNEPLRGALTARFGGDPRVRVSASQTRWPTSCAPPTSSCTPPVA